MWLFRGWFNSIFVSKHSVQELGFTMGPEMGVACHEPKKRYAGMTPASSSFNKV